MMTRGSTLDPAKHEKEAAAQYATDQEVGMEGIQLGANYLDLLRVTTTQMVYWMLLGQERDSAKIVFAGQNYLGAQPYAVGTYRPLIVKMGGLSPVALVAPEHDLQQKLANDALDTLDLNLMPPRRKTPGNERQKEWFPGSFIDSTGSPKEEVYDTQEIPRELGTILGESKSRTFSITGINEMDVSGRPMASNANRTRGGIQLQEAAKEERRFGPTEEIESMLVRPTITKLLMLDAFHAQSRGIVEGRNQLWQLTQVQAQSLTQSFHIEVRGATRMVGIARLANVFPMVMDYVLNPQVQNMAMQSGYIANFEDINRLANEALGLDKKYNFYRAINEQELQMQQQQAAMPKQGQIQSQETIQQRHDQAKIMVEQIKQQGVSNEQAIQLLLAFFQAQQQQTLANQQTALTQQTAQQPQLTQ